MSVKSFIETIQPVNANKVYVYLDSMIYPNEYGIGVRPIQVKYGSTIIDMKQLIDMFGKIPYITVKENRYRSIYREPMLMTINLTPRTFEDKTYYEYYIDKLCLRNELKYYEKIYVKAHDIIKDHKQALTKSQSINDFREIDVDPV